MKMEMGSREKKERPPQFLINRENVLLKSNQETTAVFLKSAEELEKVRTMKEVREEQVRLYKDTTRSVLGVDSINDKKNDPFFKTAGVTIDKVAIEKHELLGEHSPNHGVFSGTTLVLSQGYFKELPDFRIKESGGMASTIGGTKTLEGQHFVDIRFFDPLTLDEEHDWSLMFGFTKLSSEHDEKGLVFNQGTIALAEEPLELIRNTPEATAVATKLQEIFTWFNHDLTAHTTFLPAGSVEKLDNAILTIGKQKPLIEDFASLNTVGSESFNSAFAGELWSLNFHHSVFQEFVKARPAVMRYLRAHLDKYTHLVDKAVSAIPDEGLANDVFTYLMRAYAFGFFRLVDPQTFANDEMFKDLYEKFPNLSDLGQAEDHVRSYTFAKKKGLVRESQEGAIMPHKKVFKVFTDSFEQVESYGSMGDRIIESFHNLGEPLTDKEKQAYRSFINLVSPKSLEQIIFTSIGEVDVFTQMMIQSNLKLAAESLLEDGVTKENFVDSFNKKLDIARGSR